jgi:hypothetical protein
MPSAGASLLQMARGPQIGAGGLNKASSEGLRGSRRGKSPPSQKTRGWGTRKGEGNGRKPGRECGVWGARRRRQRDPSSKTPRDDQFRDGRRR